MTKSKGKRYPAVIEDLLIEFDEMDYCPMNLSGGDSVKEAIAWKDSLRYELDLLLDEKSVIERRAVKEFAERLKEQMGERDYMGVKYKQGVFSENDIDELLKEYEK